MVTSKIITHQAYCIKNVIRCACGKYIDKAEKEAHDKEYHEKIPCKYCSITFEKKQIEAHEKDCTRKPKKCIYCGLELLECEYDAHISNCGGKTQKCSICHKNIPTRDFDLHEYNCKEIKERQLLEIENKAIIDRELKLAAAKEKERKEKEREREIKIKNEETKVAHHTNNTYTTAKSAAPKKNVTYGPPKKVMAPKKIGKTTSITKNPIAAKKQANTKVIPIVKPVCNEDEEMARYNINKKTTGARI